MVQDPQDSLDILGRERLAEALVGFAFSSNLVSESVKGRRLVICMKVTETAVAIAVLRGLIPNPFFNQLHY